MTELMTGLLTGVLIEEEERVGAGRIGSGAEMVGELRRREVSMGVELSVTLLLLTLLLTLLLLTLLLLTLLLLTLLLLLLTLPMSNPMSAQFSWRV